MFNGQELMNTPATYQSLRLYFTHNIRRSIHIRVNEALCTPRMNFAFLNVIKYTDIIGPLERWKRSPSRFGCSASPSRFPCCFMFCISETQLFGTKNYRKTVVPIAILSAVGSIWIFKNAGEFQAWM
jgi:hypothetical protein